MNQFNNENNWDNNDEFVNPDYNNSNPLTLEEQNKLYDEVTTPVQNPQEQPNDKTLEVSNVHTDDFVEPNEEVPKTYTQEEFDNLSKKIKEKESYNISLQEERLDLDKELEEYRKLKLRLETQANLSGRSVSEHLKLVESGVLNASSTHRNAPLEMVEQEYKRKLEDHTKSNNISKVYEENMTQVFKTKYNLNDAQMRFYLKDIQSELHKDLSEITFNTIDHMLKGKYGVSANTVKKIKEQEQVNRQRQTVVPRVVRPQVTRPTQAPTPKPIDFEFVAAQNHFNNLLIKNVPAEEAKEQMRRYPKWAIYVNRGDIK